MKLQRAPYLLSRGGFAPLLAERYTKGVLDARAVYTRGGVATAYDSAGKLVKLTDNQPQFDHNPADGAFRGILFEASRQNQALRSEEFDNAAWVKEAQVTVTANDSTAPDGTTTADKYENTGNNRGLSQTITLAAPENTVWWFSIYVKLGTLTRFTMNIRRGDASDAANVTSITPETAESATFKKEQVAGMPGWYRYSIKHTFSASTTGDDVNFRVTADFNDVGTMHIWGAQMEQMVSAAAADFPTSYIPTTSAAVTRNSPTLYYPYDLIGGNPLRGTLWADFTPKVINPASQFQDIIAAIASGDGNNRAAVLIASSTALVHATVFSASSQVAAHNVGSCSAGIRMKTAYAFAENNVNLCTNGVLGTPDVSCAMPIGINRLAIGSGAAGTGQLNGWVREARLYSTRLPDSVLQTLTL